MLIKQIFSNIIKIMSQYWKLFLIKGVSYTLLLTTITVVFGTILGVLLCILRMQNKLKILRAIANGFVAFIRGTPMLVQIYIGYFLIPQMLPFRLSEFFCVSSAFVINSACYQSEEFRAGIQAVDKGQTEAARSLGLNATQTMTKIVLPQAVKNILPALGNEFITITKDTSLASTFFIGDLMTQYLVVRGRTYLTMECLFIESAIYFLLTFVLTKLVNKFEKGLHKND